MDDLISRQAAIDALGEIHPLDYISQSAKARIEKLPDVQQTLFGYKIEHLAYIARVMEKEGVTAEYAVRTFDDISRAVRMVLDEVQQKVEGMLYE